MDALILSLYEQGMLDRHEAIIERGLQTFVEVGESLMIIREQKLYRAYGTFEDYCQKRWNWTRHRVNHLIASASIIKNLEPMGSKNPLPENERQARPLAQLPAEVQPQAWQEAVESAPNGKITAAHVEAVVEKYKETGADRNMGADVGEIQTPHQGKQAYKHSSHSHEWYTPAPYIERARRVMGEIDLDPASSLVANETVKAASYYTIGDDGLRQVWTGRVFLNPPYGNEIEAFVNKLVRDYKAGGVTEAILLVAARTDTQWFRRLSDYPRCFLWGRVKFINGKTGETGDPAGFPSMAVYLGDNLLTFAEAFEDIGDIYIRWR